MLEATRERELLLLHVGLVVLALVLAAVAPIGWATLVVVVAYSGAVLLLAVVRRDPVLLRLWWFAATLSVWQVLPDLVLVELGTLVFPDDGVPDVGTVTLPMAAMWTVPTVVVVTVADRAHRRAGGGAGAVAAAVTALIVYTAAESVLPRLGIWEPVGVRTVGTVAPYILVAEVLLGMATWAAWRLTARWLPADAPRADATVALVTLCLSLAYTGAAVVSWLLLEA